MPSERIVLAVPTAGIVCTDTFKATLGAVVAKVPGRDAALIVLVSDETDLCCSFNSLWGAALDQKATRLLMLHSDVCPDPGFVGRLLREQDLCGADVLASIAPIRDGRGLTSAGSPVISLRYLWELPLTGRLAMPSEHHLFCLAATRPETSKSPPRPPRVE